MCFLEIFCCFLVVLLVAVEVEDGILEQNVLKVESWFGVGLEQQSWSEQKPGSFRCLRLVSLPIFPGPTVGAILGDGQQPLESLGLSGSNHPRRQPSSGIECSFCCATTRTGYWIETVSFWTWTTGFGSLTRQAQCHPSVFP